MNLEETIIEAIEKTLSGDDQFDYSVEGWKIVPFADMQVTFEYIEDKRLKAVYDFFIAQEDKIRLTNSHRQAQKGYGTPTLQRLEQGFAALANKTQTPVEIEFDLFNQETTRRWLIKNNYTCCDDGLYRKEILPS